MAVAKHQAPPTISIRTATVNPGAGQELARLDSVNFTNKNVFVTTTVLATFTVQVSIDGTTWRTIQTISIGAGASSFVGNTSRDEMRGYQHVRVTVNAVVGTVTVEITAQP